MTTANPVKIARIDFDIFCPGCGRKHLKQIPIDEYLEGWRGWHGDIPCECGAAIVLSRSGRGEYIWMVAKKRLLFDFDVAKEEKR